MVEQVRRIHPLADRSYQTGSVVLAPAGAAFRTSLRAPAASVAALSKALGFTLPRKPKGSAEAAGRHALWLGPDEWLLIDETRDPAVDLAEITALHSAVDVSHRNTAILVSGPRAVQALSAGVPQDLGDRAFPIGACSRTVLGKIEIVLYRTAADAWRVECWRSFSDYAFTFLEDAARDASL